MMNDEPEIEKPAADHDRWFRAKVRASMDDPAPSIPHAEAMARVEALLLALEKAQFGMSRRN
ncbi:MAG: antitoxin [Azospirillaceae bacterium]|nr:antitoxin [Azospirillaceae bacterium]